jgi:predicted small secreted protein
MPIDIRLTHRLPMSITRTITVLALLGLTACNTVQGVGRDIESIGRTTQQAIN